MFELRLYHAGVENKYIYTIVEIENEDDLRRAYEQSEEVRYYIDNGMAKLFQG